jgi:2-haloacid dehalogenase
MTAGPLQGVRACVFDAYGTIFDLASAAAHCTDALGGEAARLTALWRDKQLQYSWLRAVQGRHADFWQVTGDALDFALETLGLTEPGLRGRLMQLYPALDPFPEVPKCCGDCVRPSCRRRSCRTARPRCSPPPSRMPG